MLTVIVSMIKVFPVSSAISGYQRLTKWLTFLCLCSNLDDIYNDLRFGLHIALRLSFVVKVTVFEHTMVNSPRFAVGKQHITYNISFSNLASWAFYL